MAEDRYSRVVRWLKVLLPLAALGILLALFLVSRRTDPSSAIRYGELEDLALNSRVGAPAYSAVTEAGEAVTVRASQARLEPGLDDRIVVEEPSARIESAGGVADVSAGLGELTPGRDRMALSKGVRIETSDGFTIRTEQLDVDLGEAALASAAPIEAEGPMGQISAERMQLTRVDGSRRLVFTGGVRMLYQPATE